MTNRIRTLTVILEDDTRDDDIQVYVDAIRLLRGVASVELGPVVDLAERVARDEARRQLGQAIFDFAWGKSRGT